MTPLVGLLLCLAGMAVGLVIDCAATPPAVLASLCALPGSILANLRAHWAVMPATHLVMIAGWLLAAALAAGNDWRRTEAHRRKTIAVRLCTDTVCLAGMLGGMIAGSALGPLLIAGAGLRPDLAGLTVAMAAGMAGGMAMALPLARFVTSRQGRVRLRRVPVDETVEVWGPASAAESVEFSVDVNSPQPTALVWPRQFELWSCTRPTALVIHLIHRRLARASYSVSNWLA